MKRKIKPLKPKRVVTVEVRDLVPGASFYALRFEARGKIVGRNRTCAEVVGYAQDEESAVRKALVALTAVL